MNRKIKFGAIAGMVLLMAACKKESNEPTPVVTPTPNGADLTNFFNQNSNQLKQSFDVDATLGGVLIGQKGTIVTIAPNSLTDASGNILSGTVQVKLIEIYDRATMVFANKATVGIMPNGDLSTLVSGGEYYLNITQNGNTVLAKEPVRVQVPTDQPDFAMSLFDGIFPETEDILWQEQQVVDTIMQIDSIFTGGWAYGILDNNWGWTNVDRFYIDPRPKTVLRAKLPDAYNASNTEVFLAYDGEPGALAKLDVFTTDGFFSEHYGLIPIGLNVHFIAVTMIDGKLNYSIHGATITDNHIEYISDFQEISQVDLAILINNLP